MGCCAGASTHGYWGSGASSEELGRRAAGKLSHTLQAAGPAYSSKFLKPPRNAPLREPIKPHQTCVLSLSPKLATSLPVRLPQP